MCPSIVDVIPLTIDMFVFGKKGVFVGYVCTADGQRSQCVAACLEDSLVLVLTSAPIDCVGCPHFV